MEKEHINILNVTELFLIVLTRNKKPYIDSKNCCYMFQTKSMADDFVKDIQNIEIAPARIYRQDEFRINFFCYGINTICYKLRNDDTFRKAALTKSDSPKRYFNRETNSNLSQLLQSGAKSLLPRFKESNFLAPVNIQPRTDKNYPNIQYCYAQFNGVADKHYLLFTTLEEFDKWKEKQTIDWQPFETQFLKFNSIRGECPVLINPISDKIILNEALVNRIMK